MDAIVCALAWQSLIFLSQVMVDTRSSQDLYRKASVAIAAHDIPAAIPLLEEIVQQHGTSSVASIAAFHLAECYALSQRCEEALDLLIVWNELASGLPVNERLAPELPAQYQRLYKQAAAALPSESTSILKFEQLLSANDRQLPLAFKVPTACELARRYERDRDYAAAQHWLEQAVEYCLDSDQELCSILQGQLNFELPLARASFEYAHARPASSITILQQMPSDLLTRDQQFSRRFLLAEAQLAAGDRSSAATELAWLAEQGEQLEPTPTWLASVALRRAEMLVADGSYVSAQVQLIRDRKRFAAFENVYEFDFLLARCAIARIEFDQAEMVLKRILQLPQVLGKEPAARAAWLLGETYFLQARYAEAISAYAPVANGDSFPDWRARALLQSAKCHELLGHEADALAQYARISETTDNPYVTQEAKQRMAAIQTTPPSLR